MEPDGDIAIDNGANASEPAGEVEARPPGKRVKRLSLLSGGERSLTAVALLVAIFKARPSPFYVMDEVEAALDDRNLGRLLELLEGLRESSQLIVITHQKRTMEIADALYGVTMRGDGVSAVVSQRLRERDQPVAVAVLVARLARGAQLLRMQLGRIERRLGRLARCGPGRCAGRDIAERPRLERAELLARDEARVEVALNLGPPVRRVRRTTRRGGAPRLGHAEERHRRALAIREKLAFREEELTPTLRDLKAKLLDLPLCRLLGRATEQVPVYGSGGFTPFQTPDEAVATAADWYRREGWL